MSAQALHLRLRALSTPRFLLLSFLVALLCMGAFEVLKGLIEGELLDRQMSGAAANLRMAQMEASHRRYHLLGTATVDMVYPLAYGAFFAGLLIRCGAHPWWLGCLALGMGCDWVENLTQIVSLSGWANLLAAKSVLTPVKFTALLLCLLVIVVRGLGHAAALLAPWRARDER